MTTQTRCAIYTRKSSEEGLDQAFNSLDAQREAGIDYIKSQRHQGWIAVETAYDDGGYSGGSTDRPGLQRLLTDIQRGRVDVVLVYKVDRLSRSLADFARLMQVFDEHRVSFVSVTQQFNTTTSMGRLTLNMLLSFAQFEREVAGERIRDKIAATKRKGSWVCGQPPLGYALVPPGGRGGETGDGAGASRLRVIETEAELVRAVYTGYLELGSLVALAARLNAAGHTTKVWPATSGVSKGGRPLSTAYLYRLLTNPLYIGKISHTRGAGKDARTEVHDGVHQPIIDRATWDRVRAAMDTKDKRAAGAWTHTHLLKGKLRTQAGHAMSPGSVQRPMSKRDPDKGVRRIRYYISQQAIKHGYASCPVKSVNAQHLDDLVRAVVIDHLRGAGPDLRDLEASQRDHWIRAVVAGAQVGPEELVVQVDQRAVDRCAADFKSRRARQASSSERLEPVPSCLFAPEVHVDQDAQRTRLTIAIQIKRLDGRRVLVAPDGRDLLTTVTAAGEPVAREHLVRAIAQAHHWKHMLAGRSTGTDRLKLADVARSAGVTPTRVDLLLPLASLSPRITAAVLRGTLPPSVGLSDLIRAAAQAQWPDQVRLLGLPLERADLM